MNLHPKLNRPSKKHPWKSDFNRFRENTHEITEGRRYAHQGRNLCVAPAQRGHRPVYLDKHRAEYTEADE